MFKHMLIPTDGSNLSTAAARNAVRLAKSIGARVTGMTVSVPYHVFSTDYVTVTDTEEQYDQDCRQRAGEYLGVIRAAAAEAGVPFDGVAVFHEHPYSAIIDTAKQLGCDLIGMGSHGRKGIQALVVGSVTTKVLTHSTIPVLVWRGEDAMAKAA